METREKAMQWWNTLGSASKTRLVDTNTELPIKGIERRWESLTGREIERLYLIMKTLQEKQLELLEETVKYYSKNPQERRCISNGNYSYSAITAKKSKSAGCAIGRKLKPGLSVFIDEKYLNLPSGVAEVFEELPKNLQSLGKSFLTELQKLHDINHNWEDNGISGLGQSEVECIKERILKSEYENN